MITVGTRERHSFEINTLAAEDIARHYLSSCDGCLRHARGFFIWFKRLLALRPLLAYCVSLG
jgi:hypothetical protein